MWSVWRCCSFGTVAFVWVGFDGGEDTVWKVFIDDVQVFHGGLGQIKSLTVLGDVDHLVRCMFPLGYFEEQGTHNV